MVQNIHRIGYTPIKEGWLMRKFHVVLIPDSEDGGYTVEVVGLPGCVTQGDTFEECLKNAKEAIELHLECLEEKDIAINPIFATVEVG
ncbi:type II toxin-antitoxin system HicB family antitoxin [Microaerobacter geothermalis]|uniref:type II toxin-antitoxin system HicB family antitoxin n=1 Tax=Microaerobacter geothermalis TaxID=674972 RepID=UPI001F243314|nr:type II toxin-antitoxin system HicB family antitoxin [Microaerobacter geothermalis]MCF6095081.1 type II toxin-antitoxin system HicB family antitoxin [Microaerobacter geothermalis]